MKRKCCQHLTTFQMNMATIAFQRSNVSTKLWFPSSTEKRSILGVNRTLDIWKGNSQKFWTGWLCNRTFCKKTNSLNIRTSPKRLKPVSCGIFFNMIQASEHNTGMFTGQVILNKKKLSRKNDDVQCGL